MTDKKTIAVFGATGAQGGGLVRAILNDKSGEFAVRALTRDINSDKSKKLAEMGAEVVQTDIDNYESIKNAIKGAYGVFVVTFFWEHFSPEKEMAEVASIAKAAKETGIKHLIWSTLEDTRNWLPIEDKRMPILQEKYNVPHYDGKGESNKYFTEAGVPTTFLQTSFYWENFIYFGMGPQKGPDGKYLLTLPMGEKKLPGIAAEDIGKTAYAIFKRGNEFIGKTVSIAGGKLTGKQMAEGMSKALGKEIVYNPVSFDVYRSFGFPGADELGNMFQIKHDFEDFYCGARDIDFVKKLNPELKSFDQWAMENKSKIPLE